MKRLTDLVILTIFSILLYTGTAYAAVDNCTDCHHVDFQADLIDRETACYVCHKAFGAPSGHPKFQTADSINADYNGIHIDHHDGISTSGTTGCLACHDSHAMMTFKQVYCKTCHTNIAHENHGSVSGTGNYTNGTNYGSRTFSCINSNCHGTYATGIVKKPACSNCHEDPHGPFPGSADEVGILVNPNAANPTTHSDISVKWLYQAGDTLKESLDGITWTSIDIGTPSAGDYYTYNDTHILNWTIIYYKITHADSSEKYFPVYPPGENAHLNYMDNTALCASCHVTHAAEQAKLLKEQTVEDLCRTCHGLANTGSRYNVDTGEIVVAGTINGNGLITATAYARSNSGAFGLESGGKRYAGANAWGGAEVTSTHSVTSSVASIAPGGGHNYINLTCTSCHHSHPKKSAYRLLEIGNIEAFAVNPNALGEQINYLKRMNVGCGCHKRYIVDQNSGHVVSDDVYRHSVGVAIRGENASTNPISGARWELTTTLPTERYVYKGGEFKEAGTLTGAPPTQYVTNGGVICLTCHYAHGTTVTGTNQSSYDLNGDTKIDEKDTSTMLKRMSNDSACQDCHKR